MTRRSSLAFITNHTLIKTLYGPGQGSEHALSHDDILCSNSHCNQDYCFMVDRVCAALNDRFHT